MHHGILVSLLVTLVVAGREAPEPQPVGGRADIAWMDEPLWVEVADARLMVQRWMAGASRRAGRVVREPEHAAQMVARLEEAARTAVDPSAAEVLLEAAATEQPSVRLPLLPVAVVAPRTLASRTTEYPTRGRYRGRARNVETASERLDGVVIAPGESLSFNEVVGPRTFRNGFRRAPVIVDGEIEQGIGGGVCQPASTLHAAALEAGLRIVEARTHSRPSGYVELGMDATVVDGRQDMVIANPLDAPVVVRASANEGRLRIALEGSVERAPEVELERRIVARRSFPTEHRVDPALDPGESRVRQRGVRGAIVELTRRIDGVEESWVVRYPPTPRIVAVGETKSP